MVFSLLMGVVQRKKKVLGKSKDDKLSGSLTVYTAIEEELVPIYLDSLKEISRC